MKLTCAVHLWWLPPILACVSALTACSSSSNNTSDGGTGTAGSNTFSCLVEVEGASPSCDYYEASGPDAAQAIASARTQQCVSAPGETDTIVDSCPTDKNLGGCKSPVTVEGGNAQLTVTRFQYESDTGFLNAQQVQANCTGPNATYVPAP